MAHKSISDQILMDLRKEKEETLKASENTCIEFMQNLFDVFLSKNVLLKADNSYSFDWSYVLQSISISFPSFIKVCESLGFIMSPKGSETICFCVPKHEKGKKQTTAQKMLYNHTVTYNKKLKERNQLAQAEINRVWDSIKNRKFTSQDNENGTFTITLSLEKNRDKEICDKKLIKFLSDRAFSNAQIEDDLLLIVLGTTRKKEVAVYNVS